MLLDLVIVETRAFNSMSKDSSSSLTWTFTSRFLAASHCLLYGNVGCLSCCSALLVSLQSHQLYHFIATSTYYCTVEAYGSLPFLCLISFRTCIGLACIHVTKAQVMGYMSCLICGSTQGYVGNIIHFMGEMLWRRSIVSWYVRFQILRWYHVFAYVYQSCHRGLINSGLDRGSVMPNHLLLVPRVPMCNASSSCRLEMGISRNCAL